MKILNKKQCERFIDLAVKRLADYLLTNNLKGITLGISGGIDSAVVAIIGIKAIEYLQKKNYKAGFKFLFLDCESSSDDFQKATIFAQQFNFELEQINLSRWYRSSPLLRLMNKHNPNYKKAQGNIKARLRMIALYQVALLNNYICLDTGDLSEKWMGFWTRHGDEGDLKIIQLLTKTEVYDLGEYLHLPPAILSSPPGDGLKVTKNSLATDQLGLDYIYIEYIISRFIEAGFDYNGSVAQLKFLKYQELVVELAKKINQPQLTIKKIIEQCLKTAYKRKYSDYAPHLLTDRNEFGFFEVGSQQYNRKYLQVIEHG